MVSLLDELLKLGVVNLLGGGLLEVVYRVVHSQVLLGSLGGSVELSLSV